MNGRIPRRGLMLEDMLKGAVAGAIGVWAMDKAGSFLYRQEEQDVLARERQARVDGKDPAHALVDKVAEKTGADIDTSQPNKAGVSVHYALGIVPGAIYAVLRSRFPWVGAGDGVVYGLVLFLLQDEAAAPALGIAAGPKKYPWQTHARGLVSHIVLGIVTDTVLALAERRVDEGKRYYRPGAGERVPQLRAPAAEGWPPSDRAFFDPSR